MECGMWGESGIMLANANRSWRHKPTICARCAAGDPPRRWCNPCSGGRALAPDPTFQGPSPPSAPVSPQFQSWNPSTSGPFPLLSRGEPAIHLSARFEHRCSHPVTEERYAEVHPHVPTPRLCVDCRDSELNRQCQTARHHKAGTQSLELQTAIDADTAPGDVDGRACNVSPVSNLANDSRIDVPRFQPRLRKRCNQPSFVVLNIALSRGSGSRRSLPNSPFHGKYGRVVAEVQPLLVLDGICVARLGDHLLNENGAKV